MCAPQNSLYSVVTSFVWLNQYFLRLYSLSLFLVIFVFVVPVSVSLSVLKFSMFCLRSFSIVRLNVCVIRSVFIGVLLSVIVNISSSSFGLLLVAFRYVLIWSIASFPANVKYP